MKSLKFIFLFIFDIITCYGYDINIIEITQDNDKLFYDSNYSIIYYYNDKFPEHKKIISEYRNASKLSKLQNLPYQFFIMNVKKYGTLKECNINPPTIKIYTNKKVTLLSSPFYHKKIIRYLHKELNENLFKANSIEEIENFKNEYELQFILISTLNEVNNSDYEIFKNFNPILSGFSESINCISQECINQFGENTITLLKNYDEKIIKFKDKVSINSLNNFIINHSLEIGGILNENIFSIITFYNLSSIIYFRDKNNKEQIEKDEIIKELGKENITNYKFFIADIKGSYFNNELKELFLLNENDLPTIHLFIPSNFTNYEIKTKKISKKTIITFIKDVKEGKIEKEYNSDEVPESDVYSFNTIVGKTFKKIVLESNKPYLVLFIKNNKKLCPKCIIAGKIFQQVSDKYMKNLNYKTFGMGVIDVIYNEVNRQINNIPFISFYHVNKKNDIIDYTGEFEKEELEKFISFHLGWKEIPNDIDKSLDKEDL